MQTFISGTVFEMTQTKKVDKQAALGSRPSGSWGWITYHTAGGKQDGNTPWHTAASHLLILITVVNRDKVQMECEILN